MNWLPRAHVRFLRMTKFYMLHLHFSNKSNNTLWEWREDAVVFSSHKNNKNKVQSWGSKHIEYFIQYQIVIGSTFLISHFWLYFHIYYGSLENNITSDHRTLFLWGKRKHNFTASHSDVTMDHYTTILELTLHQGVACG